MVRNPSKNTRSSRRLSKQGVTPSPVPPIKKSEISIQPPSPSTGPSSVSVFRDAIVVEDEPRELARPSDVSRFKPLPSVNSLTPKDVRALNKNIDFLQNTAETQRAEISVRRERIQELQQMLSSVSTIKQATINQSLWASAMASLLEDKTANVANGEQVLAVRVGNFSLILNLRLI